jgi:NADP-dependent 3-hydroxy acid dehydrogenase YdfG
VKVFLTGASSGIGEALARHYVRAGATVGLAARRADLLANLAASLGAQAEPYPCDVRDAASVREAAARFIERHGAPDVVIANAGISIGNLTEHAADTEVFREVLDINVIGMVNTFQPFLATMRERRSGSLVGIASVAGLRGLPGATAYSASKAAAIRYLEGLRVELRASGVRVTTICPGYIATEMTRRNPYPMPFLITADEAAGRFARVIGAGKSYAVIPWQMAIAGRILGVLPNWLFDRFAAKAGRKPRRQP